MGKVELFGIKFNNLTMEEALKEIRGFVVLLYSEFVVRAQKNKEFMNILNSADFCLCEGKGLYLIARMLGKKFKQNINGIELIQRISNNQDTRYPPTGEAGNNQKIFLFGGDQGIADKVKEKLGDKVVGAENGYRDFNKVIEKINQLKPEILLVGLGSPKQEKFIAENLNKMPSVKLAIGVGGAFDFISGHIKRAPRFLQKSGLEWLWRLIVQPKRIDRIFNGVGGLTWLAIKNMLFLKKKNQKVA